MQVMSVIIMSDNVEHKSNFNKELYLDHVDNFYDRASLTRLRTSAHRLAWFLLARKAKRRERRAEPSNHRLEIELGRRNSTPRNERVCRWCTSHEHTDEIENEQHFIYKCSLNTPARTILINKIIKLLSNYSLHPQDHLSLPNTFLHLTNNDNNILISPSLSISLDDQQHLCIIIANYVAMVASSDDKISSKIRITFFYLQQVRATKIPRHQLRHMQSFWDKH